jgi:hypothetical protein
MGAKKLRVNSPSEVEGSWLASAKKEFVLHEQIGLRCTKAPAFERKRSQGLRNNVGADDNID